MAKPFYKISLMMSSLLLATGASAILPQMDFYNGPNKEYLKEFCPAVEDLYQNNDMTWSAPGGWKGSNPSFMHSVQQFVGAQWIGVNVGDVLCLYAKAGRTDFPITLQKQIVTISPTGGSWSADQGGHKDCKSNDINHCGFEEQIQHGTENLYEDINFYKGHPTQDLN